MWAKITENPSARFLECCDENRNIKDSLREYLKRIAVVNISKEHGKGVNNQDELKTKDSMRTIILPQSLLEILKEYKNTVNSEWMFPSPKNNDIPRDPSAIRKMMQTVLKRAECKQVRFHDLRHTFATIAIANGMDIKTLSSIIGHKSSKTTLDIYLHSTEEMKQTAADKINTHFSKDNNTGEVTPKQQEKPTRAKFEPKAGKIRKPGTGCISKINDRLYEGRYSPKDAYGKRIARNVYAPTKEECEEKLKQLITEMKNEIANQKANIQKNLSVG